MCLSIPDRKKYTNNWIECCNFFFFSTQKRHTWKFYLLSFTRKTLFSLFSYLCGRHDPKIALAAISRWVKAVYLLIAYHNDVREAGFSTLSYRLQINVNILQLIFNNFQPNFQNVQLKLLYLHTDKANCITILALVVAVKKTV